MGQREAAMTGVEVMCLPMENTSDDVACLATVGRSLKSVHLVNSSEFTTKSGTGMGDDQGSRPKICLENVKRRHQAHGRSHITYAEWQGQMLEQSYK
jgi:hypothetical protein